MGGPVPDAEHVGRTVFLWTVASAIAFAVSAYLLVM